METQDVVVYPPPRYEIVGLLQQCSYAPVNAQVARSRRSAGRELPVRRAFAKVCKSLLGASTRGGCRTTPPTAPRRRATASVQSRLWPPAPPSPSPSTPAPPASGPWSSTSRPGRRPRLPGADPALPPARAGWSTTPPRSGAWCARRSTRWPAGWPTRGRVARAIGITNQRETVVAWDRAHGRARCTGPSSGRTGAPPTGARSWHGAGHLPLVREQTGLVLDPYFSGLQDAVAARGGRGPGRPGPGPGHRRQLDALEPDRRARRRRVRHRRHQRLAHHALRHRRPALVRRAVRPVRRAARRAGRGAPVVRPVRQGGAGPPRAPSPLAGVPVSAWSATSTPPSSARPASTGA